jgi:hypothetical protein
MLANLFWWHHILTQQQILLSRKISFHWILQNTSQRVLKFNLGNFVFTFILKEVINSIGTDYVAYVLSYCMFPRIFLEKCSVWMQMQGTLSCSGGNIIRLSGLTCEELEPLLYPDISPTAFPWENLHFTSSQPAWWIAELDSELRKIRNIQVQTWRR